MSSVKINGTARRFPPSDLTRPSNIAWYLTEVLNHAEGDAGKVTAALGEVARVYGMARLARETGLAREGLYKALSPQGNPSLDTLLRIMSALSVRMTVATTEPSRRWMRLGGR